MKAKHGPRRRPPGRTALLSRLRAAFPPWRPLVLNWGGPTRAGRRFRLDRAVIGTYLTVSILHGLWDGRPGLLDGFLVPGADELAALAVVSATGLALLWWRWREAVRLQMASGGLD